MRVPGKPMRILHVIPSFTTGGVPIRLVNIANRLGPNYRHLVLSLDGVATAAGRFAPGTDRELVPFDLDKSRPIRNLVRFRTTLARIAPDLLATYNWGSIDWAIVNRFLPVCRHVHFEDGFGPDEMAVQKPRRILGRRYGLAGAERIVVPSRLLEGIARDVWKLRPQRISYIPNGVDLHRFAAAPDPHLLPGLVPKAGELVIGTVAPLRPEKRLERLIAAFARLPEGLPARLVIVGAGMEMDRLRAAAAASGVAHRIAFPGGTTEPERVLGLFDLFAISSETEQMPISVLEAMAASRAVAGVAVGDIAEMVAPANRPFIVPRDDLDGFAAAMRILLEQPALRHELGQANRLRASADFDQEAMFRAHERVLLGTWGAAAATSSEVKTASA
jgi:glycosyltransferase involved in cell wall biosynthesis